MFDEVRALLKEGGLSIKPSNARVLRPNISLPGWGGKLLKPRDCVRMVNQVFVILPSVAPIFWES